MGEFALTTREAAGRLILTVGGDLDGGATEAMQAAQAQLVAAEPDVLVLEFGGLGYMNSTGIALFVGVLAEARRVGAEVRVVGLSDHYRHIFEITRLADLVTFHDDEDMALGQVDARAGQGGGS